MAEGLITVSEGDKVFFRKENGLFRANFLTHTAVDAAQHVDFKFGRRLFLLGCGRVGIDRAGYHADGPGGADELTQLAGYATLAPVFPPHERGSPAVVGGQVGIPPLLREGHTGTDACAVKVLLAPTFAEQGEYQVAHRDAQTLHEFHDVNAIQQGKLGTLNGDV